MKGAGLGAAPTLRYESRIPYVEFNRTSLRRYAFFRNEGPLTVPLALSDAGLTIAAVFRMWPTLDNGNVRGGAWEKLLACGRAGEDNTIALGRFASSSALDLVWQNGAGGPHLGWVAGTITGQWQTVVLRVRNAPLEVSYYDGQWRTAVNRGVSPSQPIALPRTVVSCS